jgi:hypothetical protein
MSERTYDILLRICITSISASCDSLGNFFHQIRQSSFNSYTIWTCQIGVLDETKPDVNGLTEYPHEGMDGRRTARGLTSCLSFEAEERGFFDCYPSA